MNVYHNPEDQTSQTFVDSIPDDVTYTVINMGDSGTEHVSFYPSVELSVPETWETQYNYNDDGQDGDGYKVKITAHTYNYGFDGMTWSDVVSKQTEISDYVNSHQIDSEHTYTRESIYCSFK